MHLDKRGSSRRDLTPERLERLLDRLSRGGADAAERYNHARSRLVQFFAWRRCDAAEDLADEVIDRVARRLDEGEEIANLGAFFLGVAQIVTLEAGRRRLREERAATEFARWVDAFEAQDEATSLCLEHCLSKLAPERGHQLLAYYTGDGATRIEHRRRLASALGVGQTALRNRMLRSRQNLEDCLDACLDVRLRDGSPSSDTSGVRPRIVSHGDEP